MTRSEIITELRVVAQLGLPYRVLSNEAYFAQSCMRLLQDAPRNELSDQSRVFLLFVAAALEGEACPAHVLLRSCARTVCA
jgi:hypothetical protein